jgi:uncharacterized phage protein (TIGR01671 family)
MGREIKFRIWDKEAKKIRQVNSLHLVTDQDGEFLVECYGKSYVTNEGDHDAAIDVIRGHNFELMQFTGLHDKNGKEIWEGDILDTRYGRMIMKDIHSICGDINVPNEDEREVLGNIYEHPDLLKEPTA